MIPHLLQCYLAEVSVRAFSLGAADCCTYMADWLMRLGLPDVMPDRRDSYATVQDFRRMLMSEGGMVMACHRRFSEAGLTVTARPRPGDVAVVMAPYARRRGKTLYRATGAIARSESNFVMFAARGLVDTRTMRPAKIWTVHA